MTPQQQEPEDTGTIAEVPTDQQLDSDAGEGANALEGGQDYDHLGDIYADPGQVLEGDLS